jgi:hypothetical protein
LAGEGRSAGSWSRRFLETAWYSPAPCVARASGNGTTPSPGLATRNSSVRGWGGVPAKFPTCRRDVALRCTPVHAQCDHWPMTTRAENQFPISPPALVFATSAIRVKTASQPSIQKKHPRRTPLGGIDPRHFLSTNQRSPLSFYKVVAPASSSPHSNLSAFTAASHHRPESEPAPQTPSE